MLTGTMISEICNAITLADTAQKIGKGISKWEYYLNRFRKPLRIAVLGESGSGKSCFLNSFGGKEYSGESTRFIEPFIYILPTGQRIEFFDCPGQATYRNERQKIKTRILNGHFHAIINVVCYGYNESEGTNVKVFRTGTDEVAQKYLTDNRKFEIRQLKEWIDDINSQTKLRWILTLINKADVWYEEEDEVMNYYKNGEYSQLFNGIERFCTLHYIPYCSTISPFGGKPMILHISENDKRKLHFNVVKSIQQFILNVR